ncbi:MAG: acyl-CoA dehydratase activase-related protein [Sedimentibacter sp.]|uniref:acyl-CoA dehydratase activase-related protein n=1 Tax=Sedimentibacter sp. TaxID=1960295 RepID=UPI002980BA25|nr:acyl-CoA dehydratase activase-related protein [Sedimentibacter sp.]MDW5299874.1 acyl-CoA dehydratase activase-related protein [Sedimentibacter sp.]
MKATFPHMGNVYIGVKTLLDGLGIDYVIPQKNNKTSLDIGSLYSPEEICLPFKIMIGNYIQAIEQGADTIIIPGSCGPCRFGEYCELQMNLLKSMGYDLNFIVLDYPKDIGIEELIKRITKISSNSTKTTLEKFKALYDALLAMKLIDKIEELSHFYAGFERNKGECKSILNDCKNEAMKCLSSEEMIHLLKHYKEKINHIAVDINKNPLKIAIIGEIYTVIEPYSNFYIEDKLMDYGVSTKRGLTPSWWVKNTILSPFKLNSLNIKRNAKPYLSIEIGGHALECVGEAVTACKEGFDGAIQIFPMGCMPEIVSKSILPTISKDNDFPIMSLVVDDMTGEAGYITRIEAFIDLLERRRDNVLSGC